jgi:hypothetical protein
MKCLFCIVRGVPKLNPETRRRLDEARTILVQLPCCCSVAETARRLGCDESSVRYAEASAVAKLRKAATPEGFAELKAIQKLKTELIVEACKARLARQARRQPCPTQKIPVKFHP